VIPRRAELHTHLIGTLTSELLAGLRAAGEEILIEPDALAALCPVRGWDGFRRWLAATMPYQRATLRQYAPILRAHCAALAAQHVQYAEIMISPVSLPTDDGEMIEALAEFHAQALDGFDTLEIAFLLVIPRGLPPAALNEDVRRFIRLRRAGAIAGAAVVGIEDGAPLGHLLPALARLHGEGLGIEIHAGERGDVGAVWEAVQLGFPVRLGHALAAFRDPRLLDSIAERQMHIEFCVSANLATGSVPALAQHPIIEAKRRGLSFSINTDNPGMFGCSLDSEYALLREACGFSDDDLARASAAAFAARFRL
jgi:adenosine deaminase